MVGARGPQDWQQQIQEIAAAAGLKEAEVVREALAQYLGKTDFSSVKGASGLTAPLREIRLGKLNTAKHRPAIFHSGDIWRYLLYAIFL